MADELIRFLADRDLPCLVCRYNLRGLQHPQCPECGRPLILGVYPIESPTKLWIATLVATLLPTPFGLLVLFALAVKGMSTGIFLSGWDLFWLCASVGAVLCVPASVVLLAQRRRFLKQLLPSQVLLLSIPVTFDVLCIVAFFIAVSNGM